MAAIIKGNDNIECLWRSLACNDVDLPWNAPLYDLSANLVPHDDLTQVLGDMFYFKPGRHSYIARKIEICVDEGRYVTRPAIFQGQHGRWQMNEQQREACWHFSIEVMKALAPPETEDAELASDLKAVVQQLKYHDTAAGHDALFQLLRNSLGPWARIGYGLDRRREELRGALGRRGISDTLALLSLLPPLRPPINGLNHLAAYFDKRGVVPEGYRLLVKAHIDTRYFSALCGSRHNLRTEVFVDGAWMPLPISQSDLVIFPGSRARMAYGILPTLHRVLQAEDEAPFGVEPGPANTTLLLGAK